MGAFDAGVGDRASVGSYGTAIYGNYRLDVPDQGLHVAWIEIEFALARVVVGERRVDRHDAHRVLPIGCQENRQLVSDRDAALGRAVDQDLESSLIDRTLKAHDDGAFGRVLTANRSRLRRGRNPGQETGTVAGGWVISVEIIFDARGIVAVGAAKFSFDPPRVRRHGSVDSRADRELAVQHVGLGIFAKHA